MRKNKFIIFIPVAAWLIINLGLLSAWIYLYSSIDGKMTTISEVKAQIKNAEDRLSQRRALKSLVSNIGDRKQKIDSVFLDKDSLILFIESMEDAGRASGVSLKISGGDSSVAPSFTLSAEGSYGRIINFLSLLESTPYKIDIKSASFHEQGGVEAEGVWKADFEVTLLSYEN